jgi:homeodomain-containing protein
MPAKRYIIRLSENERAQLGEIASKQRVDAERKLRAQIILRTDQGEHGPSEIDAVIAEAFGVHVRRIEHLRARVCEVGPMAALERRSFTRPKERTLDGHGEAHLIALTRQDPPTGRTRWTLQLLADRLVELKIVDHIDDNTVGRVLKKMNSKSI